MQMGPSAPADSPPPPSFFSASGPAPVPPQAAISAAAAAATTQRDPLMPLPLCPSASRPILAHLR